MTDQQYTPTTDLVRWWYVLVDHSGNKSSEEYEAEFNRWLASIESAAEQRGMRLAQEAIAGACGQSVERARHRVGDILSTAQVLHVIDQASENRADQEGAQGE